MHIFNYNGSSRKRIWNENQMWVEKTKVMNLGNTERSEYTEMASRKDFWAKKNKSNTKKV